MCKVTGEIVELSHICCDPRVIDRIVRQFRPRTSRYTATHYLYRHIYGMHREMWMLETLPSEVLACVAASLIEYGFDHFLEVRELE